MKVIYLTNIPAPYKVKFFNELSKKCELTVLFEIHSSTERDNSWEMDKNQCFKYMFLDSIRDTVDSGYCKNIIKIVKNLSYDIFVISTYHTKTSRKLIRYFKFHHKKFIISSDGGFPDYSNGIKKFYKKFLMTSASCWLSSGKITDEYFISLGAKKNKIFRYPFTSITSSQIKTKEDKISNYNKYKFELNFDDNSYNIVSIGQPIYRKGFDILIKALNKINCTWNLYIIGGVMTSTDLELEDNDLKNVHFIDFLNYDELSKYLYAADLFALTTREDIWGLVINEAASFGLPIISTKKCIAATELVVDGKNGYLVNVDDINETSQAINLCRKNFSHICVDSLNISKEYTIEKMANAYINCFNEFMN